MRVLLITGEFPPMQGGVGDYTKQIAQALVTRGVVIRVLTSRSAARDELPALTNSAYEVLPRISGWGWSSLVIIRRVLREFGPEIVNIQYQTGAFGMHPALNLLPRLLRWSPLTAETGKRIRSIVTFHDLRVPYLFPKAGPVREWITRELARSCDAVVATNDEDFVRLESWRLRDVSLIPIGSNISTTLPRDYARAAWREHLGISADDLLLCHFGFVNARKGCDTLLRALVQVPEAKLLMIGGQTGASDPTNLGYYAQIQALTRELGLESRVLWTGYTPPEVVTANLNASDLCVLPYREGASYQHGTLMAALAHALPIITTLPRAGMKQRNGTRDFVSPLPQLRDGENCILVAPDDAQALALTIRRAAASSELRRCISQGARELARHFTWDRIADEYLELCARLRGYPDLGV